jgi:starch synthase (maltosyl-transferring)
VASSKRKSSPKLAPLAAAPASDDPLPEQGRARAVIDSVIPAVDAGRFPIKRIVGEAVRIEAHCLADGHDKLRVLLRWKLLGSEQSEYEIDMQALPNDVWLAEFTPSVAGRYQYTVMAWVDHFQSWRSELDRRDDKTDIAIALKVGAGLIDEAATRASQSDVSILKDWATQLRHLSERRAAEPAAQKALALDPARATIVSRYADRSLAASRTLELIADRKRAGFSSWYELFPRSAAADLRHGTFNDVTARLSYLSQMGFNVLYFPPIHPIGRTNRKGPNNSLRAKPGDVGSPWAIGSAEGGHKAILPQLGSFDDFRQLLIKAQDLGIEIAMDLAFQCAPDHPYVTQHPSWFKHRPDGSVQYAENPPKKYQDIYPFDFESSDWRALWTELKSIVDFWIAQGVKIFRVDNPHTKAFGFWEWLISAIKRDHADVIFLAEAFTRPKVMHRLAKLGFSQSYTYFTWRNTKQELTEYFTELALGPGRQYYRPNVWPNTPDILPGPLQSGLRPLYAGRLILAATLSANYGIYGPTYELMESAAREPGAEEYQDSEKYQLRHWNLDTDNSLWSLIARMNQIRADNGALQSDAGLRFCAVDNEQLIAYVKADTNLTNLILTVVNLDPHQPQSGWVNLDLDALKIDPELPYQVHDLLSDQRYIWKGRSNYVLLDPQRSPAHVFRLRRRLRSERDFDYYL